MQRIVLNVTYKGDNINEDGGKDIVWISLPENLPVYFQSTSSSCRLQYRKGIRVRFDIDDD